MKLNALVLMTALLVACNPPNLEQERQALLAADIAFAEDVAQGGAEAWGSYFAEDGRWYTSEGWLIGRDAILEFAEQVFGDESVELTWTPEVAEVAYYGDMGYTIGTYEFVRGDPEGGFVRSNGTYVTIWRKLGDGSWKVAVDIGNP
jgi:ketosteroid isomerase-like protein